MAMQRTKSLLVQKLGERGRKAYEEAKIKEVDYGNPSLPAGIEGGIAQLSVSGTGFGEFKEGPNKGKLYFMASGIVIEPKEVNGVPVAGLRTQVGPIPLCDTPQSTGKKKTFEDHLGDVVNEIRKLLGPDAEAPDFDELESVVESLKEAQPYFRFRTWKGAKATSGPYKDKEPRVVHQWNGMCDYSGGDLGPTAGVEDSSGDVSNTEVDQEGNGEVEESSDILIPTPSVSSRKAVAPSRKVVGNGSNNPSTTTPSTTVSKEAKGEPEPFSEFGDLNSLVRQAEEGDDDAVIQLGEMAEKVGIPTDKVTTAKSWKDVADMIVKGVEKGEQPIAKSVERGSKSPAKTLKKSTALVPEQVEEDVAAVNEALTDVVGEEQEGEPAEESSVPKVGSVYLYKPLDPKTKIRVKKPVECEVTAIDEETQTVSLRSLENNKLKYGKVPISMLDEG